MLNSLPQTVEDGCLGTFVGCHSAESCLLNPRRPLHPDRAERRSTSLCPTCPITDGWEAADRPHKPHSPPGMRLWSKHSTLRPCFPIKHRKEPLFTFSLCVCPAYFLPYSRNITFAFLAGSYGSIPSEIYRTGLVILV